MSKPDIDSKALSVAQIIDGRIVKDNRPVAICVKGSVLGFPATIDAINTRWPFGVTYYLETNVIVDPNQDINKPILKMTINPRMASGILGFFTHLFLFESKGMPLGDKRLDSHFIISHNNRQLAERFARYPGVYESLYKLEHFCKFSEMQIISNAGLSLSQPRSFSALDLDICRETFRIMGELGQVLFEAF